MSLRSLPVLTFDRFIAKLFMVGIISFTLVWSLSAKATEPKDPYTILVMGDSLSAEYGLTRGTGWVKLLELDLNSRPADLKPRIQFHNSSISGETTSGGAKRIDAQLEEHRPKLVVIELGANDALRGLSLTATKDNLRTMIIAAKTQGASVLLLGMQIPPNYGRDYSEKFKALFHDLAIETGCAELPFFLDAIASNREMFQADGLHPTEAAQPILMQSVKQVLLPLLTSPRSTHQK